MKRREGVSWKAQRRYTLWMRRLLLTIAACIFLVPLLWTLAASLGVLPNNSQSPPTWSMPPTISKYLEIGVTTPTFAQALETSTSLALATTGVTIVISFLAAYGLARRRGHRTWLPVQGLFILASVPVMAFILPLLVIVRSLHLYDTFAGVTLGESAVFAPLAVYVLYGYIRQMDLDLEESARLEGAALWQILWYLVLPGVWAGVAATAIIVFVLNWNMLLVPMVLTESTIKTIPIILTDFFQLEREIDWPSAAAVLIVSLVPLVVLLVAANRLLARFNLNAAQASE